MKLKTATSKFKEDEMDEMPPLQTFLSYAVLWL